MTTEMLWEIEAMLEDGESTKSIAEELGLSRYVVSYWKNQLGFGQEQPGRPEAIITIKHARNGRVIAKGTFAECAQKMGKSENYIRQMERKLRIGELKKYVIEHNN